MRMRKPGRFMGISRTSMENHWLARQQPLISRHRGSLYNAAHENTHHYFSHFLYSAVPGDSSDVSSQQLGVSSRSGEFGDRHRQGMEVDESAYVALSGCRGERRKSGMGAGGPRARHPWPRGLGPNDFEARRKSDG